MAYPQTNFIHARVDPHSLIGRRRRAASSNTLLYQLEVLKKTGRYDAFKLQWHASYDDPPNVWPVPNHLFWDSDIAKWIEGACYFLHEHTDARVESAVAELVSFIRAAQRPDGYINIHYTVVEPGKRFTDLRDMHELYNAGHLIEAALAHNHLYRNDDLLGPMISYVELLCSTFGSGQDQIHGYPGHPEIELALLRLYHKTRNPKHLELARYFVTERGNPTGCGGKHFFDVEAERRRENPNARPVYWPSRRCYWYYQAHKPLVEQETIEGHAVRAVYLLAGAADLVRVQGSTHEGQLMQAILRLWDNMVTRKMYITGGIGAIKSYEGFGQDFFLPQGTDEGGCYSETCAAIGVMMLAERLLQIDLNGVYADAMELCLYNAVLTAMSVDGRKFTYVNQLASSDEDLSKREEWFTCSCCPPNMLRLLGQIGGYIWNYTTDREEKSAQITVHLYVPSTLRFTVEGQKVKLEQDSDWPWSGDIKFSLQTSVQRMRVRLRIPAWASSFKLSPALPDAVIHQGYLTLPDAWLARNPTFTLSLPIAPRLIAPHPYTNQDTITIMRGPIVYCVEDFDNPWEHDHFKAVQLDANCSIRENMVLDERTEESYVALTVTDGASVLRVEELKPSPSIPAGVAGCEPASRTPIKELHFVPYYLRANRGGKGHMRVGLRQWHRQHLEQGTGVPTINGEALNGTIDTNGHQG